MALAPSPSKRRTSIRQRFPVTPAIDMPNPRPALGFIP
jgi:hypothetical protein